MFPLIAQVITKTTQTSEVQTVTEVVEPTGLRKIAFVADIIEKNPWAESVISLLVLLVTVMLAHAITRYILLPWAIRLTRLSKGSWDDLLVQHRVFHRLVPIVPLLVLNRGIALVHGLNDPLVALVQRVAVGTIVLMIAIAISGLLATVNVIYSRSEISKSRPIKGYLQVVNIVVYSIAGIIIISVLIKQSPAYLLSGLGAMTAVLMLVFRDTILSLVAGVQLTSNDLIRVGDWIEMPGFGADGDVIDIALNTVRVQNWDKTTSVIPTHKFLENSFKNYRTMFESGGRRIKRSLFIDMSTVRFLTPEEIEKFREYIILKDYIDEKTSEISQYNSHITSEHARIDANIRQLTNIGTFRAYISKYLQNHPLIHQELTFLVRQLQPTAEGLPLEIYVFTSDTAWAVYEGVQSDVFDHFLAVISDFGLRVYQQPSGHDIAQITRAVAKNNAAPSLALPASEDAKPKTEQVSEPL